MSHQNENIETVAVVYNEHTLGLLRIKSNYIEPLRALITKGAPFRVYDDPFLVHNKNKVRPATLEDFKEYRVNYNPAYCLVSHSTLAAVL